MSEESYMAKIAAVPHAKGLYIGPAPDNINEIDEIISLFDVVIDLRLLSDNIKEAETEGVPWNDEEGRLKAAGKHYSPCPFPDTKTLIPYGRLHVSAIKKAWELAINSLIAGKKVLIHAGRIEDNFNRVGFIAVLYMSAVYGHPVDICVQNIRKAIPRVEIDKKFIELAKSMTGQIRRV